MYTAFEATVYISKHDIIKYILCIYIYLQIMNESSRKVKEKNNTF